MPKVCEVGETARRWAPEAAVAVLAAVVFLGFLGAVDLWGKREQRAAAETIDTLREGHWLVAEIQCRKRLEKPPLPRWTIAGLMALTGNQDEWVVRLPSALSALGCVGLIYALGRRMGGRAVGLSAALLLTSLPFFIIEMRQAGNDGLLAFFTTLALYAAWRRLHGGGQDEGVLAAPARNPRATPLDGPDGPGPGTGVFDQGTDHPDPGRAGDPSLSGDHEATPARNAVTVERLGGVAVPGPRAELALAGGDRRPDCRAGLVVGDGTEDGLRGCHSPPRPPSDDPGVVRDGRPVVDPGNLGGAVAIVAAWARRRPAGLVRVVVDRGQSGDVLLLDGRQAKLLRALSARGGLADRFRLGAARGNRPWRREDTAVARGDSSRRTRLCCWPGRSPRQCWSPGSLRRCSAGRS